MKKKFFFLFFLFVIIILISLFIVKILFKKNFYQTKPSQSTIKELTLKKIIQETPLTTLNQTPTLTPQTNKIVDEIKTLEEKKAYFSYLITETNNQKLISIIFEGPNDLVSDAVDLKLDFSDNIIIERIEEGNSFSFYPRKKITKNSLIITGLALGEDNQIKIARPKSVFVKIVITKKSLSSARIILNEKESGIYYQGNNLIDYEKTFKEILL